MIRTVLALATVLFVCHADAHNPVARNLHRFDTNHDGTLTLTEALTARQARFALLDTDSSKTLTVKEVSNKAASRRRAAAPDGDNQPALNRISKRFSRVDSNHDGVITPTEWNGAVAVLFARLDSNGDQVITRAEVRELRQSRRASR